MHDVTDSIILSLQTHPPAIEPVFLSGIANQKNVALKMRTKIQMLDEMRDCTKAQYKINRDCFEIIID